MESICQPVEPHPFGETASDGVPQAAWANESSLDAVPKAQQVSEDSAASGPGMMSVYEQIPASLVVSISDDLNLPTVTALYEELGTRFALLCQELAESLALDATTIADAYADPKVFDANGDELEFPEGCASAKLPIQFIFEKLARKYHLMVGLKGSGKRTLLNKLKLSVDRDVQPIPTECGYNLMSLELDESACIIAWDLPSADAPEWRLYLCDAVSVVFVLDTSDRDQMQDARDQLVSMLQEPELRSTPLLIYANKQDKVDVASPTVLADQLNLCELCKDRRWFVQSTCAVTGEGVFQGISQLSKMLSEDESASEAPTCSDVIIKEQDPTNDDSNIAEVVLECIHNDTVDLSTLPEKSRIIAFPLGDEENGKKTCNIGRQHQLGFFEMLVPRNDRLLSISRTHFCLFISRDSSSSGSSVRMSLRHESKNPLILDNIRIVRQHDEVYVGEGTWIGFRDSKEGESPFLVLRVELRSKGTVAAEGSLFSEPEAFHIQKMSSTQTQAPRTVSNLNAIPHAVPKPRQVQAVLECVFAMGVDVRQMPLAMRTIGIPLGVPVEIGRQCQPGFFEQLLKKSPQALTYLSRKHCGLTLSSSRSWFGFGPFVYTLAVENLSGNTIFVALEPVGQNEENEMAEGETLSFIATPEASSRFLQFVFRRLSANDNMNFV